jgi:DNA-binding NarL/FixJ family response regulator
VVRVFVCDYDESLLRLVRWWLDELVDVQLVGQAGERSRALEDLAAEAPDVVVLDAAVHARRPLLPAHVREVVPDATVLVHSVHPPVIARRIAPGADHYAQKTGEFSRLIAALQACAGALVAA